MNKKKRTKSYSRYTGSKTKTYHFDFEQDMPESCDSYVAKLAKDKLHVTWKVEECHRLIFKRILMLAVNQKKIANPKELLQHGDHLSLRVPLDLLKKNANEQSVHTTIELSDDAIVWQDRWLLVARKPKGIPSQQTLDPKRDYFQAAVKRLLEKQGEIDPYLILHHRLDVDTSGLMLFCRKKSLNKAVGELFAHRKIKKTYHALCEVPEGFSDSQWEVKNYLAQKNERPLKMHSVLSGGDQAHTSFKVIEKLNDKLLIECRPHTGRTHQIRVHLAEYGLPIIGDKLYGEEDDNPLQLHAVALEFQHPDNEELITIRDQSQTIPSGN